ncbi:MAG: monovalent cation:proton antiporter-2 (CPA2) family protein [Magnetovibrionaceae bacterium]
MPDTHYVVDVVILLIAAVIAVPLFQRFRLGAILGYLVAGVIIGPHAAGFVHQLDTVKAIAELGVVFLLFTIGLELSIDKLKAIGGRIYALGILQILVTAGAIFAIARGFGLDAPAAVVVGGGLALSSTAVVMKVLAERAQMTTDLGRMVIAILILQDLAVGPLLVLLAVLGEGGGMGAALWTALGFAAIKAAAAILLIIGLGRFLMRPVCRLVANARSPEIFAAMALLVALGTSWVTEQAGLSMAFGAFLAGLVLGETEFRHQVAADIEPYRGLLLGLFFMSVGMTIDPLMLVQQPVAVLGLTLGLMAVKTVVIVGLGMVLGLKIIRSARLAGLLNQGGEFAFVLIGIALSLNIVPEETAILILVVALTMAVTPIYATHAGRLSEWLGRREAARAGGLEAEAERLDAHVIIIGYGEVGSIIARLLRAQDLPYLVLDESPARIKAARAEGYPVFYGNGSVRMVLEEAGADHARAIVIATQAPGVAEAVLEACREHFPTCRVLARSGDEQSASLLRRAGVKTVVSEKMECGLQLAGALQDICRNPKGL